MKVEVAVLGSPSLTSLMVSVDVKQHLKKKKKHKFLGMERVNPREHDTYTGTALYH